MVVLGFAQVAEAQGCLYAACTGYSQVDHTFTSGSRWTFSVQNCPCEGMVIQLANYTPRGGTPQRVLGAGSIAEIHVPYLAGTPRYLDVSENSTGMGVNAIPLSAAECAGGTLLANGFICENIENRGYAWKYRSTFQQGESVSVTMASQLGTYTYLNRWEFYDDGTIEPQLGMTGRLARYGSGSAYAPYGSRVDSEVDPTPNYALSHMHNIYYRLDVDIGGGANDAVEQMTLQPSTTPSPDNACSAPGTCAVKGVTPILTESAQDLVPSAYTTWRVYDKSLTNSDGRNMGYELIPEIHGQWTGRSTTTEPWAAHELWVTRYNPCETLAARNVPPHIDPSCLSAPTDVSTMVNGQSVDGQDVVLWYVNRHLHLPRDEDEVNMPVEWISFKLKPRSFHHHNPLEP
ncbi:MAG: copper amine oxidase [Archangium sp.]